MNYGFSDIGYNFLISSQGIYEGVGWDKDPEPDLSIIKIGFLSDLMFEPGDNSTELLIGLVADGKATGKLDMILTYNVACDEISDENCLLPFALK